MKKYLWLLKDVGFWLVIYGAIMTILFIWVSIAFARHECPKPLPKEELHFEIEKANDKIQFHEYIITKDSTVIWNSTDSQLDSLRAERFAKYLLGDSLLP